MSIGMLLISVELVLMLAILLFVPGDMAGACFIGFAIGESLGASALRIAGGIFTKIADIGSDLMKIVFNIKEDDARNPGVIADCTGDNAGDSVGPSADGFETYGVTGVALITFILLACPTTSSPSRSSCWSGSSHARDDGRSPRACPTASSTTRARASRTTNADQMDFELPLTVLVWVSSIVSIIATFALSLLLIPTLGNDSTCGGSCRSIISCGTVAGAVIPELVKVFTSTSSGTSRKS
jgi:K(+)-stimulated pyrophosphate-energized sodium pump